MTDTTHESNWRLLIGAAPLVGVVVVLGATAQGEGDVVRSAAVRAALALVAALGAAVAWRTARQLRAAPTIAIADANVHSGTGAGHGLVTLRGRAHAMPDAPPLVSPGGELCLWYRHGETRHQHYRASDSVRPFLLVDDSGQCVVLPSGADFLSGANDGTGSRTSTSEPGAGRNARPKPTERLLRDGDRIQVVGRFVPASAEAMALQARAATLVARTELTRSAVVTNDPAAYRETRVAATRNLPFSETTSPDVIAAAGQIALPVIAAPGDAQPFVISLGASDGESSVFRLLAVIDGLVLLVAGGLAGWALLAAR